uniref:Uncharacterized protein n=1 Tax=Anguilla anguilla TaxID=7936 RepID=A0A0E9V2T4_ANGAN
MFHDLMLDFTLYSLSNKGLHFQSTCICLTV